MQKINKYTDTYQVFYENFDNEALLKIIISYSNMISSKFQFGQFKDVPYDGKKYWIERYSINVWASGT